MGKYIVTIRYEDGTTEEAATVSPNMEDAEETVERMLEDAGYDKTDYYIERVIQAD